MALLKRGLKHSLAKHPSEAHMVSIMEDVWHQIRKLKVINCNNFLYQKIKTTLRMFTYGYLDLPDKQFDIDRKRIRTNKNLRKKCVLLKPDKGQGVVLLKKADYTSSMEKLFANKTKFNQLTVDPTRLTSLRSYLNKLHKRGEISEDQLDEMKPKAGHIARVHGLPKTHKEYSNILPFRPIIDTTSTPYSNVEQVVSELIKNDVIKFYVRYVDDTLVLVKPNDIDKVLEFGILTMPWPYVLIEYAFNSIKTAHWK
ncbi:hypothetical protein AC249_AIPGENE28616 [Exaiptasia diaphana]|nr:hypothetical protein AC249_AIPGENE28616 [Exaiptasia diaphana]